MSTVLSPCALDGLQQEVAVAHSSHPPQNTNGTITALYPADEFAELLTHDPERTFALLEAMTPAQCEAQAEAYVAWLGRFGLHASLALVREAWDIIAQKTLNTHSG